MSDTKTADASRKIGRKDYQRPPKGGTRPSNSLRKHDPELLEQLADWHATPEPLREEKSLRELAIRLDIHPGGRFYELARSPEVYHRMLVKTAGSALKLAPHILYVLAKKAMDGNARCAEIYLDFVRRVLTDDRIISALRPQQRDAEDLLNDVSAGAQEMLNLADRLGDNEEEALRLWNQRPQGETKAK